jgi:hypothetical protein
MYFSLAESLLASQNTVGQVKTQIKDKPEGKIARNWNSQCSTQQGISQPEMSSTWHAVLQDEWNYTVTSTITSICLVVSVLVSCSEEQTS